VRSICALATESSAGTVKRGAIDQPRPDPSGSSTVGGSGAVVGTSVVVDSGTGGAVGAGVVVVVSPGVVVVVVDEVVLGSVVEVDSGVVVEDGSSCAAELPGHRRGTSAVTTTAAATREARRRTAAGGWMGGVGSVTRILGEVT